MDLAHCITLLIDLTLSLKDEGYVQKWHLRHKNSDISEMKQAIEPISYCRMSIETCVWPMAYQIWWPRVNFGLLFWRAKFPQGISRTLYRSEAKFGSVGVWPIETYSPNLENFGLGGPVIPCGDMRQSFIDTLVKWFFDNFPMFADSFRLVSIRCVARGLAANFLYKCPALRGVTAQPSCLYNSVKT